MRGAAPEVRAFLAKEIEAGTFNPPVAAPTALSDPEFSRKMGAKRLDRHDLAEEIRRPRAQLRSSATS